MSKKTFDNERIFLIKCIDMLLLSSSKQDCEHWYNSAFHSLERLYLENKKRVLDIKYLNHD